MIRHAVGSCKNALEPYRLPDVVEELNGSSGFLNDDEYNNDCYTDSDIVDVGSDFMFENEFMADGAVLGKHLF